MPFALLAQHLTVSIIQLPLPFHPQDAAAELAKYRTLLLVDVRKPVAMFGYDGGPSQLVALADDAVWELDAGWGVAEALQLLAAHVPGADKITPGVNCRGVFAAPARPPLPTGVSWLPLQPRQLYCNRLRARAWSHPLTFSHSLCPLTPLPACRAADTSQHVRLRCGTAAGWRDHCGRGHHQHWCILGCGRWLPWLFPHLPANWRINWQWPARRRWCRTRCSRPTCHQSSGRRQRNVHVPGTYVTTTACAPPGVC
jgi:hypothetical protein